MNRKTHMRDVYSKYWLTAREKKYGFEEYDKNLCKEIEKRFPAKSKLLDVAVGTGYPVADYLQKAGYKVSGVDIAPNLIEKCQKLYPAVDSKVGDSENLSYPDNHFNCVYCFQSTWYFPNLNQAISEMIRVCRKGGAILFDIQNRDCKKIRRAEFIGALKRWAKYRVNYETSSFPKDICQHLQNEAISSFKIMVKEGQRLQDSQGPFSAYPRLIFIIIK